MLRYSAKYKPFIRLAVAYRDFHALFIEINAGWPFMVFDLRKLRKLTVIIALPASGSTSK